MSDDLMSFSEEIESAPKKPNTSDKNKKNNAWQVLIVDDDQTIHDVTRLLLSDYEFDNKAIETTHAYSAEEAKTILQNRNDFAVLLLDVVMETDHAGLDLVNYIRNELHNQFLRIVLRTGQPGQAPEISVIVDYDINDYKEKSELTSEKMRSCLTAALRSYRDINTIQTLAATREKLQKQITDRNAELETINRQLSNEIEERTVVERQLETTNSKLKSIINNSNALISLKDVNGKYDLVNDSFKESLCFTNDDIIGLKDPDIFPEETADTIQSNDQEVLQTRKAIQCEEILPTPDGEHFYLCVKFPLFEHSGAIYRICSICTDITDRLNAQNEILHLAQYDSLTDLPNRSLFIDRLQQAISRTSWQEHQIAVLFIDLDRFKVINDTLGHDIGDKLLVEIAKRLKHLIRKGDSVCRLGGDEFAVLLTELNSENDIVRVAEKVMNSLSQPYVIGQKELIVTPSIGISRCPQDGLEVQLLLKKADVAMYKAKKSGRNTYRFYLQEDDCRAAEKLSLEVDMRKMLSQKQKSQLLLHYQPKVNFEDGKVEGVEALLRWHHPERGLISPGEFIPLLEETGLILEVGKWVLEAACEFAALANQSEKHLKVAVNLSSGQFQQDNLIEDILNILNKTGCQPHWIELEVTEGSLVDDFERTKNLLEELAAMGISLAIDDFGTGYSSLTYLKKLPFNTLKIDRSFIIDAPEEAQDKAIITTIAQLAHNLNMTVVAEGVETQEQYQLLKSVIEEYDNNQVQGFIFSKPLEENKVFGVQHEVNKIWHKLEQN